MSEYSVELKNKVLDYINLQEEDATVDDFSIAEALNLDGLAVHDICKELADDGLLVQIDWPDEEE